MLHYFLFAIELFLDQLVDKFDQQLFCQPQMHDDEPIQAIHSMRVLHVHEFALEQQELFAKNIEQCQEVQELEQHVQEQLIQLKRHNDAFFNSFCLRVTNRNRKKDRG